jgi:hypothetical protein
MHNAYYYIHYYYYFPLHVSIPPGHLQGERLFTYKAASMQLKQHVPLTSHSVVSDSALAEGRS